LTRITALGDTALGVELGEGIDPELAARVRALDQALRERPPRGLVECVPTFRSLLVVVDPAQAALADVADQIEERLAAALPEPAPARTHEFPVAYGGEDGPDLEEVAARVALAPEQVAALHSAGTYTALMLGFAPGFGYLGLLDARLEVPRRATPRPRVPAGSVAVAQRLTAVYPAATAGGWHLLGRTGVRLFDPARDPPALLAPGDRVRFRRAEAPIAAPGSSTTPPVAERPAIEVLDGGLLTTVQDLGRVAFRRFGVGSAGAADRAALVAANRAVQNPGGAAALECTVRGPTLRFLATSRFAIAGADLGAWLAREDLGAWPVPRQTPVLARAGNVLQFEGRRSGCRAVLALAGGIEVPVVLGSRSTDLAGGFGGFAGRALRNGDVLGIGTAVPNAAALEAPAPEPADAVQAGVLVGSQAACFSDATLRAFFDATWEVDSTSDRVGLRLRGPRLSHSGPVEIASDGMVPGAIQVPPDGQPIVMLADAPTTGGYPKLGAVASADLDALAQLLPGAGRVRFVRRSALPLARAPRRA
jgi:KipI family sensor histidine kinase inhibitor